MNLLQHIAQSRHLLRKSELKVADHVLADPAAVMHSSMADLAGAVGISEPTIVRFCRAIGCSGFQDLSSSWLRAWLPGPVLASSRSAKKIRWPTSA